MLYFRYQVFINLLTHIFIHFKVPHKPSPGCIRDYLKKMGMVNRRALKKPILSIEKVKKRRLFAKAFRRWSPQKWRNIIFSDEKIFRVCPGGLVRCWMQKTSKKFIAKYVVPVTQKPEGVMVWAAMNGAGKIWLELCPAKVKAVDYQQILTKAIRFIRPRHKIFHILNVLPTFSFLGAHATNSSKMGQVSTVLGAR